MTPELHKQIETLRNAPIAEIRVSYREVFQEEPRSKHREHLFRRLAWRLQSLSEGGLSERARQRAIEIANDADMRVIPPRQQYGTSTCESAAHRSDRRIPPPGTKLTRDFRGATVSVKVLSQGFEYRGQRYRSLSAIANEVTGTRWNGLAFFGLTGKEKRGKGLHGNAKR